MKIDLEITVKDPARWKKPKWFVTGSDGDGEVYIEVKGNRIEGTYNKEDQWKAIEAVTLVERIGVIMGEMLEAGMR